MMLIVFLNKISGRISGGLEECRNLEREVWNYRCIRCEMKATEYKVANDDTSKEADDSSYETMKYCVQKKGCVGVS